jgi:type I restriction enzyme S subunit
MGYRNSSAKWIPKNSLVVALAGQGKTKGTVAYLKIDTTGNQSLAAIVPNTKKVSSKFLFFYLKTAYKVLRGSAGEGKRDGLNLEILGNLEIVLPTIEEQKQISNYLDEETQKIDAAIELQQKQIEKLKEYRASLIDNVVTGKARVVK